MAGNSKLEAIRSSQLYIARKVFGIIMCRQKQVNQSQIAAWLLEGGPRVTGQRFCLDHNVEQGRGAHLDGWERQLH